MILMIGPVVYYIRRAKRGDELYVRRIAGIDAIDEAVGRAAELGKPVAFTTGLTNVSPVLYACLGALSYITRKVARYKNKLIIPQNDPEVMAIAEDVVRDAYTVEGMGSYYDPESMLYLSGEQFAFASGYIGVIQREKVGAAFLFGSFAAESLILAEAGQQIGAMQVAASVSPEQVTFFICTCDYTLIGEELYAASAYLTREPIQLGSLYGQDRAKLVFFFMIIVGVVIATIQSLYPAAELKNIGDYLLYSWSDLLGGGR